MKINLSYEIIVNDIRKLAININNSDTKYDAIISIAGGGLIPGRLLRNYLNIPIYSVNVKFYNNNNEINNEGQIIQWLSDKEIQELSGKNVLIVDDLDDTRTTLLFIINKLKNYSFNKIGIAVLYNKKKDKTGEIPLFCEYFVVEDVDNYWINFPWEMSSDISLSNYSDNEIFNTKHFESVSNPKSEENPIKPKTQIEIDDSKYAKNTTKVAKFSVNTVGLTVKEVDLISVYIVDHYFKLQEDVQKLINEVINNKKSGWKLIKIENGACVETYPAINYIDLTYETKKNKFKLEICDPSDHSMEEFMKEHDNCW